MAYMKRNMARMYSLLESAESCKGHARGVRGTHRLDSKKLAHIGRMICAGCPSFSGLGLEKGHVPTVWPLHQE